MQLNTTEFLKALPRDTGLWIAQFWPVRGNFSTYVIALALVGFALLARLVMAPVTAGFQYVTFFPAVALAAIIGGVKPGLLATIVGVILATYFFTPPYYSLSIDAISQSLWSSIVFLLDGIIVSSSIEAMHRFRCKAIEELNEVQQQNIQILQLHQETEMLQQHTQLLMQNSMDGIHIMDMQGNIVMVNDAFCRMLGYTQQEVVQLNLFDWSVGLTADKVGAIFTDRIGKSARIEAQNRRKDGDIIDVEISVTGVLLGEQGFVYASSRDITERKKAEAVLEEREALLSAVMKALPVGIWLIDKEGKVVFGNDCAQKIWAGAHYVGLEKLGVYKGWWTKNGKLIEANEWAAARAIEKGEISLEEEIEIECFDGTHKIILNSAQPYSGRDGGISGAIIVNQDITERKKIELERLQESDSRFRGTLEQAAVGIVHAGLDGCFRQVNQKFCDIVGYTRDELLNMSFQEITFAADLDENIRYIRQLLAGDISTFAMEKRYVRKDCSPVWVNLTVSLLRDADGMPNYTIAVVEDITERKHLERQMRDLSMHLLTIREEEKASVAREIHDNLGGTLTALKMDVYWLADEMAAYHGVQPLQEHVNTMSQLLDNAVDVTRRVITDLRPTILDDLGLQAALEWQARQFQKRTGIQCRVACIEGSEVKLDKIHTINLFRIFQESLTNVARHSGASDVDAELRYEANGVVLIINDNGCGLQEGHTIASTSYGMLGMRERAEQLGGEIYFSGSPDAGFCVTVILPLDKDKLKGEGA